MEESRTDDSGDGELERRVARAARLVKSALAPCFTVFESRGRSIVLIDDDATTTAEIWGECNSESTPGDPVKFATLDANRVAASAEVWRNDRRIGRLGLAWTKSAEVPDDATVVADTAQTVADILTVEEFRRRSIRIVDLVPHAIVLETASGERLLTNSTFDKYVAEASQSGAKSLRDIIDVDIGDLSEDQVHRDVRGIETSEGERVFEVVMQPYRDWTVGNDAIMAVMTDLTDIEKSQEQLRLKQRQLETANADLERSNEELEQFAYVASHDLQEPLRMVSSFLSLLVEEHGDALDGEAREYVEFAVDGARRMKQMVNELLAFSRVRTNEEPLETVDVNEIVDRAVAEIRQNHPDSQIEFDIEDLPVIQARPDQLRRVFANLFINAVRHAGRSDVHVEVSCSGREGFWEFSVVDNGSGVPDQQKGRVFDIFVRGSRDDEGGSGIGLAVCATVAAKHGGRIWVEDAPTGGAAFKFTVSKELEDE